ncbi:DNA adenine methylase [Microvirgula aerodenitrificans]|uniref:DNA adenine methylase n=1 Tax=Microvirgula aerodenitrificans TaxID=57480 RepID=UPI0009FC1351|nr:DNA adenine methylase [Microvirgula aerodenitrificans]
MPTTESPLRYPGGKTQLAPFVSDLLRVNGLQQGVYAEPFAGGAGLAWRLLLSGQVGEVWLNDIDPCVYALWDAVLNQSEALCERIAEAPITLDEWHHQRSVFLNSNAPTLDRAFSTLFMNRTNRSGILLGGVIGGKSQDGVYKLDCRFNRNELVRKIQRIARHRDVVRLTRLDAAECIALWSEQLPPRSLMNIDPPYFAKGQELYINFYTPSDHASLAAVIRELRCPWMLTYDDVPQIEDLYTGLPVYRKSLVYYAQVKRKANELLVLSPQLRAPDGLVGPIIEAAL